MGPLNGWRRTSGAHADRVIWKPPLLSWGPAKSPPSAKYRIPGHLSATRRHCCVSVLHKITLDTIASTVQVQKTVAKNWFSQVYCQLPPIAAILIDGWPFPTFDSPVPINIGCNCSVDRYLQRPLPWRRLGRNERPSYLISSHLHARTISAALLSVLCAIA